MAQGQPSKTDVIPIEDPLIRTWNLLVQRNPRLHSHERSAEPGKVIIQQGRKYDCAIMILTGSMREEMTVHHKDMRAIKEIRCSVTGRLLFMEAISEEYREHPARYSIIAETPAQFVLVNAYLLEVFKLLSGAGTYRHDAVLELIQARQETLDALESTLCELIEAETIARPHRLLEQILDQMDSPKGRVSIVPDAPLPPADGEHV
jgi:hypothetical protein